MGVSETGKQKFQIRHSIGVRLNVRHVRTHRLSEGPPVVEFNVVVALVMMFA